MKILNFGSLNIDLVYQVPHFVRAGETIASTRYEKFPGGKGLNQSVAIGRAGACVYHAGKIGGDGAFLIDVLKNSGVDTGFVLQSDTSTGNALIQVDAAGQNCILLYSGANKELAKAEIDAVLGNFTSGDLLLLQNEINMPGYIIERANGIGMRVALNPSPIDEELLQLPLELVDYFILNEIEGEDMTGETDPDAILDILHKKYPKAVFVLTLGKHGVRCFDGENHYRHSIYDTLVVDTTAAGDTFTGYFLAQLAKGADMPKMLETASKASSIAVSRKGAAPSIPTMQEVEDCKLKELR